MQAGATLELMILILRETTSTLAMEKHLLSPCLGVQVTPMDQVLIVLFLVRVSPIMNGLMLDATENLLQFVKDITVSNFIKLKLTPVLPRFIQPNIMLEKLQTKPEQNKI